MNQMGLKNIDFNALARIWDCVRVKPLAISRKRLGKGLGKDVGKLLDRDQAKLCSWVWTNFRLDLGSEFRLVLR